MLSNWRSVEPRRARAQVCETRELPAEAEDLAQVKDRPLQLAFGASPVRPTVQAAKVPVCRDARELFGLQNLATFVTLPADDYLVQPLERQSGWRTT